eukprot:COSAG05_NODE_405_length_10177_cov_2.310776_9_plen_186_part_00
MLEHVRQRDTSSKHAWTSLGKWDATASKLSRNSTLSADGEAEKDLMVFANGDRCYNGPERSARVAVKCGEAMEVLAISETNVCEYNLNPRLLIVDQLRPIVWPSSTEHCRTISAIESVSIPIQAEFHVLSAVLCLRRYDVSILSPAACTDADMPTMLGSTGTDTAKQKPAAPPAGDSTKAGHGEL